MTIQIENKTTEDKKPILEIVKTFWGDETILAHNEVFHISELEGLKASDGDKIIGFLHYQLRGEECEIITLASTKQGQGVGIAIIAEVEKIARNHGCLLISLITTNDNLLALGFYQWRGFRPAALFPGQVIKSRLTKSGIPEVVENNIPIRDELRLEKILE